MTGKSFIVDNRRKATMVRRLGKASKLVNNASYLPMFRNRQIRYQEEFEFSVNLSKNRRKPAEYFATIWSPANLEKTLGWLRAMMARAEAAVANLREDKRRKQQAKHESRLYDQAGINRLNQMKRQHNLLA